MAVRPIRPALRERYDRRRGVVVRRAARQFARHGYDQTTMHELAATMDLTTGALYHYFPAKEQLLRAICDQLMEPLLTQARALADTDAEPAERLRALVRLWVAHVVKHRDHMLVFQQERHVIESGRSWRGVRASRKAFERLAAAVLAEAGATGEGPLAQADVAREGPLAQADVAREGPVSQADAAREGQLKLLALLGMVNHTAQWYRPRGPLTAEQIADGYVDLVLARDGVR